MSKEEVVEVKENAPKTEKKEKNNGEKSLFSKIVNIALWIILFAWMAIVLFDFIQVRNENEPKFCVFDKKTITYEDGNVEECLGIGYKVIKYNRETLNAIEFGPFWISDRTSEES
jgi:hypothetical protein